MKAEAIVYTSNTGHTERYAKLISEETGLPVYSLSYAKSHLPKGTPIIYLGWLFVSRVKGYSDAAKRFRVCAVCGVGLCDTGELLLELRQTMKLPQQIPVFTFQGGIEKSRLHGINRFMINMLIKMLQKKQDRTEEEDRMLELLLVDCDYVSEDNLSIFLEWYRLSA